MAPPARFELTTCGLEIRCSIQLSYRGVTGKSFIINDFESFLKNTEMCLCHVCAKNATSVEGQGAQTMTKTRAENTKPHRLGQGLRHEYRDMPSACELKPAPHAAGKRSLAIHFDPLSTSEGIPLYKAMPLRKGSDCWLALSMQAGYSGYERE